MGCRGACRALSNRRRGGVLPVGTQQIDSALVAGAIYGLGVRPLVASKMRQRLLRDVLADPEDFRKAWKIKGLGFRHEASKTLCESPDGRWRSFVLETCAAGDRSP